MADIMDVLSGAGDVLKAAMPSVNAYLGNQMAIKQAKQLAKIQAGGMMMTSRFPTIGMGYGATPLTPSGMPMSMGFGVPSLPAIGGVVSAAGGAVDLLSSLGLGGGGGGPTPVMSSSIGGALASRDPAMIAYGKHTYRSLGRPLLWSGDLSAAKRVHRIAGKLRRFSHHRFR